MGEAFGVSWGDPSLYDLTLNTERVSIPTCVDQVLALVRSTEFQETPASRHLLENLALEARARGALRADERTNGIDVVVAAEGGTLRLEGIVANEAEKSLVGALVSALPGVKGVRNDLRTMSGGLRRFPSQVRH